MKILRGLIVLVVLAAVAAGLWYGLRGLRPTPPPPPEKKGPLYIGLIAPQSGPLKNLGQSLVIGAEMALEAAAGEVRTDRPFNLLIEDEAAASTLPDKNRLVKDPRVSALVGHLTEGSFEKSLPLYLQSARPVLLPVLSGDGVTPIGQGRFYQLMPSDSAQAEALAGFARNKLQVKNSLVIHEDSDSGRLLAEAFARVFRQDESHQMEIEVYPDSPKELLKLADSAATAKPDAVFLAVHGRPAVFLAQALVQAGLKTTLLGIHALALSDVIPLLERLSEKTFVSLPFDPFNPNQKLAEFTNTFQEQHHRFPDWLTVQAFDAVSLAAQALTKAGDRPEAVKNYLDGINGPGQAYHGLIGDYYFKDSGRAVRPVYILQADKSLLGRVP